MKRQKWTVGGVLYIDLKDGWFSAAQIISKSYVAFYDAYFRYDEAPNIEDKPVAFVVGIYYSIVTRGEWPIIKIDEIRPSLRVPPTFYKFHPVFRHYSIVRDGVETMASPEECAGLELWAVWDREPVEERLRSRRDGRPERLPQMGRRALE